VSDGVVIEAIGSAGSMEFVRWAASQEPSSASGTGRVRTGRRSPPPLLQGAHRDARQHRCLRPDDAVAGGEADVPDRGLEDVARAIEEDRVVVAGGLACSPKYGSGNVPVCSRCGAARSCSTASSRGGMAVGLIGSVTVTRRAAPRKPAIRTDASHPPVADLHGGEVAVGGGAQQLDAHRLDGLAVHLDVLDHHGFCTTLSTAIRTITRAPLRLP
jgi:hypothetical protein